MLKIKSKFKYTGVRHTQGNTSGLGISAMQRFVDVWGPLIALNYARGHRLDLGTTHS